MKIAFFFIFLQISKRREWELEAGGEEKKGERECGNVPCNLESYTVHYSFVVQANIIEKWNVAEMDGDECAID